jgi:hypothetical protein
MNKYIFGVVVFILALGVNVYSEEEMSVTDNSIHIGYTMCIMGPIMGPSVKTIF